MYIDTLTDDNGVWYEYGHCYQDNDADDSVTGCGMEYAYYPEDEILEWWLDSVGLISTKANFTATDMAALESWHHACHKV